MSQCVNVYNARAFLSSAAKMQRLSLTVETLIYFALSSLPTEKKNNKKKWEKLFLLETKICIPGFRPTCFNKRYIVSIKYFFMMETLIDPLLWQAKRSIYHKKKKKK